ncbi:hypothetical protein J4460_05435 [Candidatus Woesearchaeota archaeon]|nr:hypothetical protein [Candidatus Woesearchaeota archaeon]HIH38140.1 hypothetical protein [Candidatus Woesearchaeota archaeon]HIH49589.1 hypothetical protein [Candidatus Woesearchaeota archaeon]HIJ04399.1 hypothetical protein [Candidatus Woesearchaeota archaeon]
MTARNAVVWGTQSTMDYNYRMNHQGELVPTLEEILTVVIPTLPNVDQASVGRLQELKEQLTHARLENDIEVSGIDGSLIDAIVRSARNGDLHHIDGELFEVAGGGSPFISAWASMALSYMIDENGHTGQGLPDVYYVGLLPENVEAYLRDTNAVFPRLRKYEIPIGAKPATLAFEFGNRKIMISNGEGRQLSDLKMDLYIDNLKVIVDSHPKGRTVIALGGLNKGTPEEYEAFIQDIKERFGEKVLFFVGTNSFKGSQNATPYITGVLPYADIVSFNEKELAECYDAAAAIDKRRPAADTLTLAYQLRLFPHLGIKICHAVEGAIGDLNFVPEKIISPHEDMYGFVQESLELAVDGIGYLLTHNPRENRYPNITAIRDFSRGVQGRERNNDNLEKRFNSDGQNNDPVPGMHYVSALKVPTPYSRITGAGATFDGLALALLMRG